jgi:hypothetical protein
MFADLFQLELRRNAFQLELRRITFQLELRRTAAGELAGLHRAASAWFAGHGCPVEAIRNAGPVRFILPGHRSVLFLEQGGFALSRGPAPGGR